MFLVLRWTLWMCWLRLEYFPLAVRTLSLQYNGHARIQHCLCHLGSLMDNSNMLSQVTVLLATNGTGRPVLVMNIVDVSLQVCLQIAAVATLCALKVLHLTKTTLIKLHHKKRSAVTCMCCWLMWCLRFVNSLWQWGHGWALLELLLLLVTGSLAMVLIG